MSSEPGPGLLWQDSRKERAVVVVINGRIERLDIPRLCELVLVALEESGTRVVVCDVDGLVAPDALAVDALARLQLTARRRGGRIRLHGVSDELRELLVLTGLCEVLPSCAALGVETGREPEQREHPLGVEEEHDPGDAPARDL